MGMVVRTNTMALNAYRQLGMNNSAVSKSLEKLASGYRINRAGDDAAGLAISEKMKAQITGLETASANAQDGISLIQTAEGNLSEVHDMLNRMVELATKSANGTYTQTERDALQSEVDQLLDEIDRISQSANFNGAKLLDGTIGMNSEAFKLGEFGAVEGQKAVPGAKVDLSAKLAASNVTDKTILHLGTAGSEQKNPSFKVSLGDYAIDATNATGDVTLAFNIAGSAVSITLNSGASYTTKDIADAIVAQFNGVSTAGSDAGAIGAAYFTASANTDGTIDFTYAGMVANTTNATADDEFNSTQATAINGALSSSFTVAPTLNGSTATGAIDHDAYVVINPEAKVTGSRAGIDLTLDATVVADGNTLTIDGKTFVFKTDATSNVKATGNQVLVDVSDATKYANDTARIAEAVDQISQQSSDNFIFEAKSGSVIHVDQKVGNANTYDTYKKLTDIFSAAAAGTPATGAGTELTITSSKIAAGDKLKVGGKTYTFGDGTNDIKIGDSTVADLKKALENDGFTVSDDGNKLTISAAADQPPVLIGGDGLTLQIGDTADSFNKMTVGVPNMGTLGLGLDGLVITNQVAASNAIDTIKTAINSVSTARADMGALQNRLEHTINNLDVAAENLSAANSRIRDTDMAKEMMNYTKMNVLVQSAQAMLAQANQQPQSVLQLLQ